MQESAEDAKFQRRFRAAERFIALRKINRDPCESMALSHSLTGPLRATCLDRYGGEHVADLRVELRHTATLTIGGKSAQADLVAVTHLNLVAFGFAFS